MQLNNYIDLAEVEKIIGYSFNNKELLLRALTHSSFTNEHINQQNYERLEFLGDATLGYVIALYLYETYPNYNEGQLTKMRAGVVDRKTIAEIVNYLNIMSYVRAGSGNTAKDLSSSVKVKCDIFEAIIGAILIDNNNDIEKAKKVILGFLQNKVGKKSEDYKSKLLELCAKSNKKAKFDITESIADNNSKLFTAKLYIDGKDVALGKGYNIKEAEQSACKKYFEIF